LKQKYINYPLSFNFGKNYLYTLGYINLNGKIIPSSEAGLPVDNGAFRYGYGLFETMLVKDGMIRLKEYHWERLFAGLEQLYLDIPALTTIEWLEAQVLLTVKKNKLEKLCRVRLQFYAGGGGLYSAESSKPGFVIECFSMEAENLVLNENGIATGIATGLNKSMDSLSNLKSCNALIYTIAARQARENKWNDALICNTENHIIESTIANIFWIKDGIIYTPPLADGCVAGVMRRYIKQQIGAKEKSLTVNELTTATEVFLTNAIKGIRWVKSFGDATFNNAQTTSIYNAVYPV
jgi:branched-chain amino acid aminotransferase